MLEQLMGEMPKATEWKEGRKERKLKSLGSCP